MKIAILYISLVAAVLALGHGARLGRPSSEYWYNVPNRFVLAEEDDTEPPPSDFLRELADQPPPTDDQHVMAFNQGIRRNNVPNQFALAQTDETEPPPSDYLRELADQPPPTDDQHVMAFNQGIQSDDQNKMPHVMALSKRILKQGDEVAFQLLSQKTKFMDCLTGTYCDMKECPGMFMDRYNDWIYCKKDVFRIYRNLGPGNVRVGDVVALNYVGGGVQGQWLGCTGTYCIKGHCMGNAPSRNSRIDRDLWFSCSSEAFIIYAMGKNKGDYIHANDEIGLYSLHERNWVASQPPYLYDRACLGTARPPPSSSYDKCVQEVFELWVNY